MSVVQVVQEHPEGAGIKNSVIQIAEAFGAAFDLTKTEHTTLTFKMRGHGKYPEHASITGLIRHRGWEGMVHNKIVLCHDWGCLVPLKLYGGCGPIIQVVHSHHLFDPGAEILKNLYPFADAFLAPSREIEEIVSEHADPSRVYIVPHPFLWEGRGETTGETIVWVGRAGPRKNLSEFIRTIELHAGLLASEKIGIYLEEYIRDDAYLSALMHRIERHGLPVNGTVHFGKDAFGALSNARIYVSTSRHESCPRTVVAAGLGEARLLLPYVPWAYQYQKHALMGHVEDTLPKALLMGPVGDEQHEWFHDRYTPGGSTFLYALKDALEHIVHGGAR